MAHITVKNMAHITVKGFIGTQLSIYFRGRIKQQLPEEGFDKSAAALTGIWYFSIFRFQLPINDFSNFN